MNIEKLAFNIPQLKQVVDNSIAYYNEMLYMGIRTIGLGDKIKSKLKTLSQIQTILAEHKDKKEE